VCVGACVCERVLEYAHACLCVRARVNVLACCAPARAYDNNQCVRFLFKERLFRDNT